jgi:hypothetical protein
MNRPHGPTTAQHGRRIMALVMALLTSAAQATVDDDDAPAGAPLVLTSAQVAAVGIDTVQPVAATPKASVDGYGRVVDTSALVGDLSTLNAAQAAARTSANEVERLRGLHAGGAAASLKVVQAAQGEQARVSAEALAAQARFNARWTPIAALAPGERDALVQRLRADSSVLLRADLPGRTSVEVPYAGARVLIDDIAHDARVLGALGDGESTNASVLLELRDPPAGLARGARLAVTLEGEARAGFIVPRGALLHDEHGAHVYVRLAAVADGSTPFLRRDVQRLMRAGSGWLVSGVDADDAVVVRGLGLLWSMQGGAPIDDDD